MLMSWPLGLTSNNDNNQVGLRRISHVSIKNLLRTSHNFYKNRSLVCFSPLFADFWYWEQDAHGSLRGSDVFPTVWQALLGKWVKFICRKRGGGRGNVGMFVNNGTFVVVVYWDVI